MSTCPIGHTRSRPAVLVPPVLSCRSGACVAARRCSCRPCCRAGRARVWPPGGARAARVVVPVGRVCGRPAVLVPPVSTC